MIKVSSRESISITQLSKLLKDENNFVISFHINPDYDAVASSLALSYLLDRLDKNNIIVSEESRSTFESNFSFLPEWEKIKDIKDIKNIDLSNYILVSLDSGDKKRLGKELSELANKFKFLINIDHHRDNDFFGNYNLVETDVVSAGEIIFKLAKELNIKLSKELATYIYASILGDGGSFRFDSVKPSTHLIAAELLETGIKPSFFNQNMYQNKKLEFIKLEGEVFQNIKTCCNDKVVWVIITDELLKKYGIRESETEPIIEDIGRIKDCIVYFTIKEKVEKNVISVAFRSKGDFDVSKVARNFGGGGHKNAAGAVFDISQGIDFVETKVLEELKKYLES
ncbi:MAG: DHH family phosphoesterase [Brevinematia bacterium]